MNLDRWMDLAAVPHNTQPRMQCTGLVYLDLETGRLRVSTSSSHGYSSKISVMREHHYRLNVCQKRTCRTGYCKFGKRP
jgi:hypothetical protein